MFDAMAMKFSELGVARSSDREEISELLDYQGFCAGPKSIQSNKEAPVDELANNPTGKTMDEVPTIDSDEIVEYNTIEPIECLNKMANGWSPWVIDVRLQSENDIVELPFTDIVVPHRTVGPDHVPLTGEVLVYCKGGVRGKKACAQLVRNGVDPKRLFNLEGGIMRWQKEVDLQMPRY